MKQTGRVLSVNEKNTIISVIRQSACGDSCASCSAKCSLKDSTVTAETVDGLEVGDMVIFEMAASKVLFAAFLVYITPLFMLIGGYLASTLVLETQEGMSVLVGIVSMIVWFVVVHFIDKKLNKYYKHKIVQKIEGDN